MHKFKQAFYTPKSCILAQSHTHLTVGEANLTVKMGCSHCEQCQEVERSAKITPTYTPTMEKDEESAAISEEVNNK